MTQRTLNSTIPPTFSKSPQRDVSSRLVSERNVFNAKTTNEVRSLEVGKSGDTLRLVELDSMTWAWLIVVPIAVWCLLFVLMPTFVKKQNGNSNVDHQSLLIWTLIISLVIWILFFGFAKCKSC